MTDAYNALTNAAFKYCELSETEKSAISSLYQSEGRQRILAFAKNKKILPFVAVLLAGLGFDEQFWGSIADEYRQRNEAIITRLDSLFVKFSQAGIKKVFVNENFGALLAADADKALFASGDVDMYADIAQKAAIYIVFEQLGYTKKEHYANKKLISTTFYNDSVLPTNFHFGVAWHPLSRTKLPCFINADDFVEWDSLNTYKNSAIKMPDIDALMYICLLHISLHSFSRAPDIRLYIDVNNMSKLPVDWDKILFFARRDKTMTRVLVSCVLANRLLSVEIPDFVLDRASFPEYRKQVFKLLKLVYDDKKNCLIYEPKGIKVLRIEALTDSPGYIQGIAKILFPDKKWVRETYAGANGNTIAGYIKHIMNVF